MILVTFKCFITAYWNDVSFIYHFSFFQVETFWCNPWRTVVSVQQHIIPSYWVAHVPSSHFSFLVNMAPDCISNYMGPACHNFDGSFATNFIFTTFLLLFTIPIQVQVVTICDRLCHYKQFNVVFKKLYHTLQAVYGLYRLARECHQLHTPER